MDRLKKEFEKATVGKQAATLEAKLTHQELQKQTAALQSQLDSVESEKNRLATALKNAESSNSTILENMNVRSNETVEEMVKKHRAELQEIEDDRQQIEDWAKRELCKLKQCHDEEKTILHQRWQDEKTNSKENEDQTRDSLQQRIQEEGEKHDEERQMLTANIK